LLVKGLRKRKCKRYAKKEKKTPELTFFEQMRRLQKAGLSGSKPLQMSNNEIPIQNLTSRVEWILDLLIKRKQGKNSSDMICFIMYDIEHNKVRNHIARYLIRKGCMRVQKSVFVVHTERKKLDEMHKTLKEVQAMYQNDDSIFFLPVTESELSALRVIGRNVDFELVTDQRNTLFL
jgi:CRISPR-associated protein Cas2